ncbi:MAG TPA: hypothetical protein VFN73_01220 [Propionibacteriaceae bacterium]|nr:hypothetical protein [Propionibacteriaceae bacterium]
MSHEIVAWAVTVLMVALVLSFAAYLVSVARLPGRRPRVRTYDGRGRLIGRHENPGEQIAPGRRGDPRGASDDEASAGSGPMNPPVAEDGAHDPDEGGPDAHH